MSDENKAKNTPAWKRSESFFLQDFFLPEMVKHGVWQDDLLVGKKIASHIPNINLEYVREKNIYGGAPSKSPC